MSDGEASAGPRMENVRFGEPGGRKSGDPFPCGVILLSAPPQRAQPLLTDMVSERFERAARRRHREVVIVAGDDGAQPFPLFGYRLMHALSQPLFDRPELRPHAVAPGLAFDQERAPAALAADEGEAQEVEGLRLGEPAPPAVFRRQASELDQPGL